MGVLCVCSSVIDDYILLVPPVIFFFKGVGGRFGDICRSPYHQKKEKGLQSLPANVCRLFSDLISGSVLSADRSPLLLLLWVMTVVRGIPAISRTIVIKSYVKPLKTNKKGPPHPRSAKIVRTTFRFEVMHRTGWWPLNLVFSCKQRSYFLENLYQFPRSSEITSHLFPPICIRWQQQYGRANTRRVASLLALLALSETSKIFDSDERPRTALIKRSGPVGGPPLSAKHVTDSCPLLPQRGDTELGSPPPSLSDLLGKRAARLFIWCLVFFCFFTYLFHFCAVTDRNPACNKKID